MSSRSIALLVMSLLLAAAVGGFAVWRFGPTSPTKPSPEPPVATPTPSPTPEPEPAERVTVRIYLTRGEKIGVAGRMVEAASKPALARAAVEALLEGPTAEETGYSLDTAIPEGVTVRDVTIGDDRATVDLSASFASGGGSLSMQLRAAQIVYTLTQFDGIERVAFLLDGDPIDALGGEGIDVDDVTRLDFEDVTPPVLVESPYPGQQVQESVIVSGTSNVFEATHQLQVVGPDGTKIHDDFVTATSGTGTRGNWSVTVDLSRATRSGDGRIVVFEYSAENGQKINQIEIPIRIE